MHHLAHGPNHRTLHALIGCAHATRRQRPRRSPQPRRRAGLVQLGWMERREPRTGRREHIRPLRPARARRAGVWRPASSCDRRWRCPRGRRSRDPRACLLRHHRPSTPSDGRPSQPPSAHAQDRTTSNQLQWVPRLGAVQDVCKMPRGISRCRGDRSARVQLTGVDSIHGPCRHA